ncbi:MAG: FtsX-like permease family protein [Actinomycetaceae bacterium]|nr:hypothetical protein [Actinomycetaceae bacterium]MDY6083450.1 FtsX-like permease family protein [Actinomycetaceae bacterium]
MSMIELASKLASARLHSRRGTALLDAFAVISFAASSFLMLTVFGGLAMFLRRRSTIDAVMSGNLGLPSGLARGTGAMEVLFAVFALALLIVPLLTLGAGAARLGAQGRSKRLAALRLVGMTAGQVQRMSVFETLVQYVVGFVVGLVLYLVSLPAWHAVSFETEPIRYAEMLLPWWGFLLVFGVLALLASASTMLGLIQVSISPLGVARRVTPRAMRMWRFVILVAVIALAVIVFNVLPLPASANEAMRTVAIMVLILCGLAFAFSVAGPLFVQLTARVGLARRSPAALLAARRVIDDPRSAWRNISGVVLMGFVAGVVSSLAKISLSEAASRSASSGSGDPNVVFQRALTNDIVTGVIIAFAFSLVIGAVSTMVQQASDVFDRVSEERALIHMGAPMKLMYRTRMQQVMWPFVVTILLAVGVGVLPGLSFTHGQMKNGQVLLPMLLLGVVITVIPVLLTRPIERRLLLAQSRRND